MKSVVSVRGQTVIPKEVREALGIRAGTKVEWLLQDGSVRVFPIPENPVRALRGVLKGKGSTAELLAERRAERDKEEAELEQQLRRWRSTP